MKSFILEQFSLINQKKVNEQSVSDRVNNSEAKKFLLDQIKYWGKILLKVIYFQTYWTTTRKVLFNDEESFSYISNRSNLNSLNNQKLSNIDKILNMLSNQR